ncbi:MAG: HAMP domain-containing sensor histidine kinase [Acidimicrobiia bacterium]
MSLRWKLALSLAVLGAFIATFFGFTAYLLIRNRLLAEVDRSLTQSTAVLVDRGRVPQTRPGGSLLDRSNLLELYAVQRLNRAGEVVADAGVAPLPVSDDDIAVARTGRGVVLRTVTVETTKVRVRTTATPGTGAVMVARSFDETERVLRNLSARLLFCVIFTAIGAAGIGWLVAWRMTRPLTRLTGAAEHVALTEDLDADVPDTGRDEVGRLGHAFRNMLNALRTAQVSQRRLVQDASHELKTPLTSIRTNTAVLRKYPELDPASRERILEDLNLEVEELVALVDELVEVALEGRSDETPAEVDLAALVARVATRIERRTGHRITVMSDSSLVIGQPGQLERAVSNLLLNAAKFDQSSVPIEVRTHHGRVEVRDHGPGIPPVDRARVFERFYRSEAARSAPGSGLGLAIVRDVARAHGGDVFLGDAVGGGAIVGFQIPVAPPSS